MGNWFELGYTEMNADPGTFIVLSNDFGKDKQNVFWNGLPQQADVISFVVDNNGIPKDNAHVYYAERYGDGMKQIPGADPKTYQPYLLPKETYNQRWARDHHSVYLYGQKVDADRNTFERINQTLAFDSLYFYAIVTDYNALSGTTASNTHVVRKDAKSQGTPESINDYYARLDNSIVHSNWNIEFSIVLFDTIKEITIIDERNISVDQVLVSDGIRLDGVDVSSLEIIDRDYFKDSKHVYYKTKVLPGANPTNFKVDYNTETATDGVLTFKDGVLVQ